MIRESKIPAVHRTLYKRILLGKHRKEAIPLYCRYYCKDRRNDWEAVKGCQATDCPLWPFRFEDTEPSPFYCEL